MLTIIFSGFGTLEGTWQNAMMGGAIVSMAYNLLLRWLENKIQSFFPSWNSLPFTKRFNRIKVNNKILKGNLLGNEKIEEYIQIINERPEEFIGSPQGEIIKDSAILKREMKRAGRSLGVVYESPYHIMVVDLLKTPEGKYLFYERILNTVQDTSVVIVPIYQDKFVLLHQYQGMQYAFPPDCR